MANILFERADLDAKPNSVLSRVTVYQGRAQIFRRLRVRLRAGTQTVVFTSLGREIEEGSIRAQAGDGRARVVSVALERKDLYFFNKAGSEKTYRRVVEALTKLIELGDRKTILAVEAGLIADLRSYLERALNDILLEQGTAITRLREALDFLRDLLDRNRDDALSVETDLTKAAELYSRLSAALEAIRRYDLKVTHAIRIELESEGEMETDIDISYMAGGASWRPSYDAALEENGKRLTLCAYAEITQASGEDWEQAAVTLSSSETETGIDIPQLHPLGITGWAEKTSTDVVAADEDISDLGAEGGTAPEPRPSEAGAGAEKRGTAYAFVLPRPETIPADGKSHRLLIRRDTISPELCFETAPALMEYVYLKASFTNAASAPLLPGPVMIFRNGSYIGRTRTGYAAPGERCELSFGIDLDIKVKRIVLKDAYVPSKGVGLMRRRLEYAYRYILSHFKDRTVAVILKEAIPVSEVEKISVSVESDTSPGCGLDKEGIARFTVEIPAGKKEPTLLLLHYSVDAPKSINLQGA